MSPDDTIAAIITAPGEAGVSILRVSGSEAFSLADRMFRCPSPPPSERERNTFVYGKVVVEDEDVDEGLLLIFRKPHSYTAEDVVEFHFHGGTASSRKVLQTALAAGARLAEPGEFTRRAFLNGRIDLLQAEAVMDVIRAHSERSQTSAVQQLEGKLSIELDLLYEGLMTVAAQVEATLDFPEDELPDSVIPRIQDQITACLDRMDQLLATWTEGHVLRDGALVVLSGKPNVGKSTLLNELLGHERAIVSDIPGTTRDTIEAEFQVGGFPMRLVDTAGIRESSDQIEKLGIKRTQQMLEQADLHLHVLDLSQSEDEQSRKNLDALIPGKSILICNKADLPRLFHVEQWPETIPRVETALIQDQGIDAVKQAILDVLSGSIDLSARPHAVISERHRQAIQAARAHAVEVSDLLQVPGAEESLVLAIPSLRDSLTRLGEVTGREYHEELLDEVFSTFCIGK